MPATRKPTRPTGATRRAATYCRISSDPFGLEAGVERQRKDTAAIARQHGYTVAAAHRFEDNDRSASRYARRVREGWAALMDAVEAGEVHALVAYNLDRLLRQPKELERLIDAAEAGLEVATATGKLDLATTEGRTFARMACAMAAAEADKASDRQRAKLRHDAANGVPHWARRPYGYAAKVGRVDDDGKRVMVIEPAGHEAGDLVASEAAWVLKMAAWVADDGLSASEVARRLNAEGVTTTMGKPWQAASVKDTLTAPRTAGLRAYNGAVGAEPASWAPILERPRWEQVRAVLASRSTGPRGGGRRSMLSKLVRCGRCDSPRPMTRTNTGERAEWRCVIRPDTGGCGLSVSARQLERVVVDDLLDVIAAEPKRRQASVPEPAEDVEALRAQLHEYGAMLGRGEIEDMDEYRAITGPLRDRIAAAERQAATARLNVTNGAAVLGTGDKHAAWEGLNDDAKRRLVALYVERITVKPAERRGGSFDANRVVTKWKG